MEDTSKPNPNIHVGAMAAGPDKHDGFHDMCANYNYTEPTVTGIRCIWIDDFGGK